MISSISLLLLVSSVVSMRPFLFHHRTVSGDKPYKKFPDGLNYKNEHITPTKSGEHDFSYKGFGNHHHKTGPGVVFPFIKLIFTILGKVPDGKQKIVEEKHTISDNKYKLPKLDQTTETEIKETVDFSQVKILNLTSYEISTITAVNLVAVKNLEILVLRGNKMKEFCVADLPYLPELKRIDLSNNPLVKLDLNGTEKVVPKLDWIDLSGTKISADELEKYQKQTTYTIVIESTDQRTPPLFPTT